MPKRALCGAAQSIHEFEQYKKRQVLAKARRFSDGEQKPGAPPGRCSSACKFKCLSRKCNELVFLCTHHQRVHVCGDACAHRILNHEHWSCPLTGEVVSFCFLGHRSETNS